MREWGTEGERRKWGRGRDRVRGRKRETALNGSNEEREREGYGLRFSVTGWSDLIMLHWIFTQIN
jgi:hypothetical protein